MVMDNLSCPHYQGGEALDEWLGDMGIELTYTPTYSPELNPIEESFSKIKSVLTNDKVRGNVDNLKLAVINATMPVTPQDMHCLITSSLTCDNKIGLFRRQLPI